MHARELTRRLRARGNSKLTVNALNPGEEYGKKKNHPYLGMFPSELSRHLGPFGRHWKRLMWVCNFFDFRFIFWNSVQPFNA